MRILYILLLVTFVNTGFAADSGGGSGSSSNSDWDSRLDVKSELTEARQLIASERYKNAIRKLNDVVRQDYRNADAWNLLGYSHRKMGKFKRAGKAYRKALKFNPEHRSALEYQGELFLELQDLEGARENLARLAALCPEGCEEWTDLDAALANR